MGAFKHLYKQKKIFNSRSTGVHLFRFFNHISGPMLADRVCSVVMEIALLAIYCLYGVVLWLRSCSSCSGSKYSKTETNKNQFYQTAPCIKCETVTECEFVCAHWYKLSFVHCTQQSDYESNSLHLKVWFMPVPHVLLKLGGHQNPIKVMTKERWNSW